MATSVSEIKQSPRHKRKALICAIVWTVIYILIFPMVFQLVSISMMVFDNPTITALEGLSIIFMCSLIPLSLPVTIDLMWSSYLSEEYKKTFIFWLTPWLLLGFLLILCLLLEFLHSCYLWIMK